MAVAVFKQDPEARLDYEIDWSGWLEGDILIGSQWETTGNLEIGGDDTFTETTTKVWLSGGTAGTRYGVTNHVVTAGGRKEDRTIKIKCKEM